MRAGAFVVVIFAITRLYFLWFQRFSQELSSMFYQIFRYAKIRKILNAVLRAISQIEFLV